MTISVSATMAQAILQTNTNIANDWCSKYGGLTDYQRGLLHGRNQALDLLCGMREQCKQVEEIITAMPRSAA